MNSSLNQTHLLELYEEIDALWLLVCSFFVITMQTGFALFECGCVSLKNVTNIIIKNCCDMLFGGLSYWMFGYALSFGRPSNWFCGYGDFFFTVDASKNPLGTYYIKYFFQLSFASTASTIVSGAVAERMKLHAYMIFSFLNTAAYSISASWIWNTPNGNSSGGFLHELMFFDFAGVCVVHLKGGVAALVAAGMLGARTGRFEKPQQFQMSSPVTTLTGLFMLWWAWLAFNCGSTNGLTKDRWKVAALVSVTTFNGSIGGGVGGVFLSLLMNGGRLDVGFVCNAILGGLVGITGVAPVTTPWEALLIGCIGGFIAILGSYATDWLKIDDPVGAIPVHMLAAIWGTIAVGLFGRDNSLNYLNGNNGLFHGGDWYLLGVQSLGCLCMIVWSAVATFVLLFIIKMIMGIRMSSEDEVTGADWVEHQVKSLQWVQDMQLLMGPVDPDKLSTNIKRYIEKSKAFYTVTEVEALVPVVRQPATGLLRQSKERKNGAADQR